MAVLLAQLPGPINLRLVLSDLKFADILHDLVTAKGNRSGVPRALAVDHNETRELAGTLHIEALGVPVYSYTDNIIPTMTSATAPSGVVSASSENTANLAAWKAFNHAAAGVEDGWWPTAGTGSVQYQFPAPHTITKYAITVHPGYQGYAPKTWTFQGSNDGASWATLDTQTNIFPWAASERKVFAITNATAYSYYRLDITAGNDAGNVAVGELEMMETVISYGSGKDDAIAQIRAINALVTVGTTLTLQSTGATNAVTLNILPSRGVSQPLDELFELDGGPVLASCAFSFTCEPYAYGPLEIPLNGPITIAPCVLDLGTIKGDYPTPLNISFAMGANYIHCLYVGRLKSGSALTIDDLLTDLEGSVEWSGGSPGVSGVLADAHDLAAEYNVSTSNATRNIIDQSLDDGTYLLLNRGRMENAVDAGTVEISFAGKYVAQTVLGDLFYIGDLGTVRLPNQNTDGNVASSFPYNMHSSSGVAGHAVYADYLGYVPTSWGFFRWHSVDGLPSTACSQLSVSEDGMFVDGVANASYWRGGVINAVGPTKLALFGEPYNTALTAGELAFYTTVTYRPRYNLWR